MRIVSRLITFGLPALAFYEAMPHPSVDMREQFADLFTVLQVGCLLPAGRRAQRCQLRLLACRMPAWTALRAGCTSSARLMPLASILGAARFPGWPRLCGCRVSQAPLHLQFGCSQPILRACHPAPRGRRHGCAVCLSCAAGAAEHQSTRSLVLPRSGAIGGQPLHGCPAPPIPGGRQKAGGITGAAG